MKHFFLKKKHNTQNSNKNSLTHRLIYNWGRKRQQCEDEEDDDNDDEVKDTKSPWCRENCEEMTWESSGRKHRCCYATVCDIQTFAISHSESWVLSLSPSLHLPPSPISPLYISRSVSSPFLSHFLSLALSLYPCLAVLLSPPPALRLCCSTAVSLCAPPQNAAGTERQELCCAVMLIPHRARSRSLCKIPSNQDMESRGEGRRSQRLLRWHPIPLLSLLPFISLTNPSSPWAPAWVSKNEFLLFLHAHHIWACFLPGLARPLRIEGGACDGGAGCVGEFGRRGLRFGQGGPDLLLLLLRFVSPGAVLPFLPLLPLLLSSCCSAPLITMLITAVVF